MTRLIRWLSADSVAGYVAGLTHLNSQQMRQKALVDSGNISFCAYGCVIGTIFLDEVKADSPHACHLQAMFWPAFFVLARAPSSRNATPVERGHSRPYHH